LGIKEALDSGKHKAEAGASSKERDRYQLVLVDTQAAITHYMTEHYPRLRNTRSRRSALDSASYHAGKDRGASIRVNRPLT